MTDVKIGIIGNGRIGCLHADILTQHIQGCTVTCLADPLFENAQNLAKSLGIKTIFKDYHDLLKENVDAVYICSSTDTHAEIMIEAARAGKHIFCEKPIDLSYEKVEEALHAVKKAGVQFQIGFNRRFDHQFSLMKKKITEGEIGDIHLIKITSRDPAPPPLEYIKKSGGIFLDMTIHDFDMACFLSESEVVEVSAMGAVLVDKEIGKAGDVDTAITTLKFKNGTLGVIDNSRKAVYGYDQRLEVFGSKGMISAVNETESKLQTITDEGERREKPLWFFLERYKQAYREESLVFIQALLNKENPILGPQDGLAPILIGLAARKSLQEKRCVRIDEIRKAE